MPRDHEHERPVNSVGEHKSAVRSNADAAMCGQTPVISKAALMDLRAAIRVRIISAREAGCHIEDIVRQRIGGQPLSGFLSARGRQREQLR